MAAPKATSTPCVPTSMAATVPAMATIAPTEMSMPRVAITSVMAEGDEHQRHGAVDDVHQAAVEVAVPDLNCRKPGTLSAATASSSTSAMSGRPARG